jgi:DnaJ-domain-containing protein 1
MSTFKDRVVRTVRANLNDVLERIREFEAQGGFDAFFEAERERLGDERFGGSSNEAGGSAAKKGIREYYANLEVPYGSDLDTVKASYLRLMRRYHPDRYSKDSEMEALATELSQEISQAYTAVKSWLENGRY